MGCGTDPGRRRFLRISALAAASVGTGALGRAIGPPRASRGNHLPGRIVLHRSDAMEGHLPTINRDQVEQSVLSGVCSLTGRAQPGAAFEALFPGVTSSSTFAIKVNMVGPNWTRWETTRGVVSGLSRMFSGTFDVGQVTIFDRDYLSGYDVEEFTFNGNHPVFADGNNPRDYYVYEHHRLSNYLVERDYVINIPALKSHLNEENQITVAMKCHYGSCNPSSLCGDITGMLTVNADPNVRDKTCLILTDAIRGTYNGGPNTPPMFWDGFPQRTPNMLLFTTDPVTNEYWARDIINAERALHGMAPKPCPWIELASAEPWNLGVSDPAQMTIVNLTDVEDPEAAIGPGPYLAPPVPNPVAGATLFRFRLPQAGKARIVITDASGRLVRHLAAASYPAGDSQVSWDGRGRDRRRLPAGVYFARLETAAGHRVRQVALTR